jgi:hypothetical protein
MDRGRENAAESPVEKERISFKGKKLPKPSSYAGRRGSSREKGTVGLNREYR